MLILSYMCLMRIGSGADPVWQLFSDLGGHVLIV